MRNGAPGSRLPKFPVWLAAAVLWSATPAFGGVTVDDPDESAYDDLISQTDFDSVGLITSGGLLASGVYIGDGWVLTAAHVVDTYSDYDFTIDGVSYDSQSVYVHDEWDSDDLAAGYDIALIQLTDDVAGIDAALFYDASDPGDLIGQTVTYTGYGLTGEGDAGATGTSGSLVGGQNVIDAFGGSNRNLNAYDESIFFSDFDDPDAASDGLRWSLNVAVELEYLIASGDSGGGVFIEEDGEQYLIGVNSFVLSFDGDPDSDYGDLAGATYLPDYYDWITATTGIDFITAIPEPTTAALFLATLPVLQPRRRVAIRITAEDSSRGGWGRRLGKPRTDT